jgi:hypothetical protein
MPPSQASLGYGSKFDVSSTSASPPIYVALGEVFNITPPSMVVDQVDVSHMQSPLRRREFIDGLIDPGECSFQMNYVPGSPSDLLLLGILDTAVGLDRSRMCRITYPNGLKDVFDGNLASYEPDLPTDDKMTATVTFKVSGAVTRTP